MLIYEKNNKLNINFDNEISENPDVQIGKDGDKTEVLVDGSSNPAIPVPVLPEDVGKTIVVNEDGSYTLANAGGGNEVVYMATINAQNEITIETDYQTIKTDINDGKNVKILATHTASVRTFVMELQTFDNTVVTFCSMYPSQQGASYGISIYYLSMNETGTNTFGIKSVS